MISPVLITAVLLPVSGRVTVTVQGTSVITDARFSGYELHLERPVEWMGKTSGHVLLKEGPRTILKNDEAVVPKLYVWHGSELFAPDERAPFDSTVEVARDITGDGIPELLLTDEPAAGGNAVNTLWIVISLGSINRVLAELSGDNAEGGKWRYIEQQKVPVFDTAEAWPFWSGGRELCFCHWCIGTLVTLQYRDGAFRLATGLMHKAAPAPEALKEFASKIPAGIAEGCPPDALPNKMLELIFSGNAASAFRLFDLAWPGDSADKRAFRSAFLKRLEESGYCRDVQCR